MTTVINRYIIDLCLDLFFSMFVCVCVCGRRVVGIVLLFYLYRIESLQNINFNKCSCDYDSSGSSFVYASIFSILHIFLFVLWVCLSLVVELVLFMY